MQRSVTETRRSRSGRRARGARAEKSAWDGAGRRGGAGTREAGPVKGGTTVIAFAEDPDGYKIEFIERKQAA